jgi:hypothetical protein
MQTSKRQFQPAQIVTANDVSAARSQSVQARVSLEAAEQRLYAVTRLQKSRTFTLAYHQSNMRVREFCDAWITRQGGFIILILTLSLADLVVWHALGLPLGLWPASLLAVFLVATHFGLQLFSPGDDSLRAAVAGLSRELVSLKDQKSKAETEVADAQSQCAECDSVYSRILKAFQSRINRLRVSDWESLQGVPFENFLMEVFLEWGYEVETTKVTGDQGVDLIVSKNDSKVAVQAKGYPSSTVGNSAVQEAHTGMRFYGCQRCVVITNSTFTSAARKLAEGVECTLIDHDMIPLLIEGEIALL